MKYNFLEDAVLKLKWVSTVIMASFLLFSSACTDKSGLDNSRSLSNVNNKSSPKDETTATTTNIETTDSNDESGDDLNGLGLEDYEKVAKQIFLVKEAMSDEFPVGDGLTFTLYILRYLAEVGEYELPNADIVKLVSAFETISGEKLNTTVHETIAQISKLEFGKKNNRYFVKIFSKDRKKGIVIGINELSEDDQIEEIKYAKIKNKAKITFTNVDSTLERAEITRFLTEKISLPLISESWLPPLNQMHSDIEHDIKNYLKETKIIPLKIRMKGIFVKVKTNTILKNMDFYLRKVYTLPGRKKDDLAIPSFVMRMRSGVVNVKMTIDQ